MSQVAEIAADFELAVLFTSKPSFQHDLATVSRSQGQKSQTPGGHGGAPGEHPPPGIPEAGPQLDFVVRREFDYAIPEVAQGRPWDEIQGLSYGPAAAPTTTRTGPSSRIWTPFPWSRRFTTGT